MVPAFRSGGDETSPAASAYPAYAARSCASADAAARVTPASTAVPSSPRWIARRRKSRPMSASTSNCLRFNFGNRSVPPATNIARGPRSDAMRAASRAVFGRRYLNRGSRSIAIQFLGRGLDLDRVGIRDVGKTGRTVPGRLALVLAPQGLDDLLGRDRDLVDPHPERVEHGRAHGGYHREQRSLSGLLRAIRSLGVDGLDDEGLHLGHVEEGRRLVLEHRRPLVKPFAKRLLLHERLSQAHVHAAFDLALDEQRVDGAADVVREPDLVDLDEAGPRVGLEVDHAGGVAVSGAGADPGSLVGTRDLRRRVTPCASKRAKARLGQDTGRLEGEIADPALGDDYFVGGTAHLRRRGLDEQRAHAARRL